MTPEGLKIQWSEKLNLPIDNIKKLQAGSTYQSFVVESENKKFLIKTCEAGTPDFQYEVAGLKQLKNHGAPVPEVLVFDNNMLAIDFIEAQAPTTDFWQNLGQALAELHKHQAEFFGFFEDNMIGRSQQKNIGSETSKQNWADFFWHNRIEFKLDQLQQTQNYKVSPKKILQLKDAVFALLQNHNCHPSPLHGDLWNGNIVCGPQSQAFLIDPAFYFGDRETDVAMTECFGGFSDIFYQAYNETYPLEKGYQSRKHLYNLYHMLNHFVIFGSTYQTPCESIIDQLIEN